MLVFHSDIYSEIVGIASGGRTIPVPYTKIANNNARFIDPMYLPGGFELKDPTNMAKSAIEAFIRHVQECQEIHGNADAFCWKVYEHRGHILDSRYGISGGALLDPGDAMGDNDDAIGSIATPAQKKKAHMEAARGKQRKGKGKQKPRPKKKQWPMEEATTDSMLPRPSMPHWAHGLTGDTSNNQAPLPLEDIPLDPQLTMFNAMGTDEGTFQGPHNEMLSPCNNQYTTNQQNDGAFTMWLNSGMSEVMVQGQPNYAVATNYGDNVPVENFPELSGSVQDMSLFTDTANPHPRGVVWGPWYPPVAEPSNFLSVPPGNYAMANSPAMHRLSSGPSGSSIQTHASNSSMQPIIFRP